MVSVADLIGTPFRDGGRDQATGLDCWGLVMEVYRRMGITVPDYGVTVPSAWDGTRVDRAAQEAKTTGLWMPAARPQPGDLIAMHTDPYLPANVITHFGVVIGINQFIHQVDKRRCEAPRLTSEWRPSFRGFYRWRG